MSVVEQVVAMTGVSEEVAKKVLEDNGISIK